MTDNPWNSATMPRWLAGSSRRPRSSSAGHDVDWQGADPGRQPFDESTQDLPGTSWCTPGASLTDGQAACWQVVQVQSLQTHDVQGSPPQCSHEHTLWLHVGQVQPSQAQTAQLSVQSGHAHFVHSS